MAAQGGVGESGIPSADRSKPLAAAPAQQRLWFLDQLDKEQGAAYHIPAALRLKGRLDVLALQAALDRIVDRHEVLRTVFTRGEDGRAMQSFQQDARFALEARDLAASADGLAQAIAQAASEKFDLERGPLVRGVLFRIAADDHVLLVTMHHIVADGWSVGVLLREVAALYGAFSQGQVDPLPPLQVQYADVAAWQAERLDEAAQARQLAFWSGALAGAPSLLELPLDRQRAAQRSSAGGHLRFAVDGAVAGRLRELSRRHGVTIFMTLFGAWSVLMARMSGQDDIVSGTPLANRQRGETSPLLGFFANTVALRVNTSEATVGSLLAQVKASMLEAFEHQDLPFEQVVEALKVERSLAYNPVFQVMFSMNNAPASSELSLPGLVIEQFDVPRATTQFDLNLAMRDDGGELSGSLDFATALFDAATARRFAERFQVLLAALSSAADDAIVATLPVMSVQEEEEILARYGALGGEYDAAFTIHGRFEEQVAAQPDAIALTIDGQPMTYGELNANANRMAHRLLELGVQPDDRVAICAERGFGMIAGLLAIMKAGGGYVPLDPVYPDDRLAFMLGDCAPRVVLADSALASRLDVGAAPLMLLDDDFGVQPAHNPALEVSPSSLAYVIYTSGSTGLPKGVMIEHRNVARLMTATDHWFGFGPSDVWTLFHSFAFDFSVWEIWGALLTGGRLVVVPYLASRAPQEFYS
ncbi:condensation domain-containing protein, partial [Duganella sp. CF458]|uniref:condensation domain-containing protein n=1 Tax=Duganella sp. CF458 TaxID=1884368 RepID=UPI001E383A9B